MLKGKGQMIELKDQPEKLDKLPLYHITPKPFIREENISKVRHFTRLSFYVSQCSSFSISSYVNQNG